VNKQKNVSIVGQIIVEKNSVGKGILKAIEARKQKAFGNL